MKKIFSVYVTFIFVVLFILTACGSDVTAPSEMTIPLETSATPTTVVISTTATTAVVLDATSTPSASQAFMVDGTPVILHPISATNIQNLELFKKLNVGGDVQKLVFSPDGKTLAVIIGNSDDQTATVGKHSIQLWNYLEGSLIATLSRGSSVFQDAIFKGDTVIAGTCKSISCQDGGEILTWRVSDQALIDTLDFQGAVVAVFNNQKAVTGQFLGEFSCLRAGKKRKCRQWDTLLWNIASGTPKEVGKLDPIIQTFPVNSQILTRAFPPMVYSPDQSYFAVASGNSIKLQQGTGNMQFLGDLAYSAWSLNFSSNGKWLVSCCNYYAADIWNVSDASLIREIKVSNFSQPRVFSPDSSMLASPFDFWDTSDWKLIHSITYDDIDINILSMAFAPDGTLLATGGLNSPYVYLWGVR